MDWNAVAEAVARQLKGEPNTRLSSSQELRWGSRGSFHLSIAGPKAGCWHDWEAGEGGRGAIRLTVYLLGTNRDNALQWLRQQGYLSDTRLLQEHRTQSATPPRPQPWPDNSSIAQSIWASGSPIPRDDEHPAQRWLAQRRLWRRELLPPPMLRWLPAGVRHTGAGSIVALLAAPTAWASKWPGLPTPTAVQLISIDQDGTAAPDKPESEGGLSKRTIGIAQGAVLVIGNPVLSEAADPVRVAEGLADSLAIAARYEGPVVAMSGTSGMRNPELAAWLATSALGVVIHADRDRSKKGRAPAGSTAAAFLRQAVNDAGGAAEAVYPPGRYKDAAEAAQAVGFAPLDDHWIEYARTLVETTGWPRWEVARIAQSATTRA